MTWPLCRGRGSAPECGHKGLPREGRGLSEGNVLSPPVFTLGTPLGINTAWTFQWETGLQQAQLWAVTNHVSCLTGPFPAPSMFGETFQPLCPLGQGELAEPACRPLSWASLVRAWSEKVPGRGWWWGLRAGEEGGWPWTWTRHHVGPSVVAGELSPGQRTASALAVPGRGALFPEEET